MLADCLHDLAALGPGGMPALMGALFLAGLAGGATHCAAMCGPFVLAQASAGAGAGGGVIRRLSGAALLPYHLGRLLGYAALGALAGGTAGALARVAGLHKALAALLLLAALLMLGQALRRGAAFLPTGPARLGDRLAPSLPGLPGVIGRPLGALLGAGAASPAGDGGPGWGRGLALGLLLSALPCGLLYGALAAAAAAGSALAGALTMAAFVLGTVPALVGVAALGRFFGRRNGRAMQAAGAGLFALNALVLAAMAARVAGMA
jgi:hypothetical protein